MHSSVRRWVALVLMLVTVAGVALSPASTALADVTVTQTITATPIEFSSGKFGLTGLAQGGGVQLVPIGTLRRWQEVPGGALCRPLVGMATAAFGPYLWTFGGETLIDNVPVKVNSTCRTRVIDTTGQTEAWQFRNGESIPENLKLHRAVAFPHPSLAGKGMVVLAGGEINDATGTSTDKVYAAVINEDGSLGAWQEQAPFPDGVTNPGVRQNYALTAYTNIDTNTTFIYAIGGQARFFVSYTVSNQVLKAVVQPNGTITEWVEEAPMPLNPPPGITPDCLPRVGLKDHGAANFDVLTDTGDKRILAVLGGFVELGPGSQSTLCPNLASEATARTMLAEIDQFTGNITWLDAAGTADDFVLPEPLSQMGVIGLNQKLYTTAGLLGENQDIVTNNVYSSFVDNQLNLPPLGESNFLLSQTALATSEARTSPGMEYVVIDGRPIAYLMGGLSSVGAYRDDVLFGFVGLDDDTDTSTNVAYVSPGIYQSRSYQLRAAGQLQNLQWSTSISSTGDIETDIKMEFRTANSLAGLAAADWIEVDGDPDSEKFSVNGANSVSIADAPPGIFLQYRAFLYTNQTGNRDATPILRGPINIQYLVDGFPNLFVESASMPPIPQNGEVDLTMVLANGIPPGSPVVDTIQDANLEGGGTLFVDLYAFPPGVTPSLPQRDPTTGAYDLTSKAFAEINKDVLAADQQFNVPPSIWRQNCGPTAACPAAQWDVIFNQEGTWSVIAIIDSSNNVREAETLAEPWENDNIFEFTIQSNVQGGRLYLPLVRRPEPAPPPPPVSQ